MAKVTVECSPFGHKLFSYAAGKVRVFVGNNKSSKELKTAKKDIVAQLDCEVQIRSEVEDED
ncbi:hypothetical protein [Bifidobacterium choladohabitans]|uniref:hypothetical protein n=1 Tax=Bifidobacterium choladohabitans TaxID=2750947 RepID=UPI0018DDD080|nr:hypothetical protein [Bifidobacterium choladohabitans]MBI0047712.1 hypothetical protein [Bifidobacterium choladohabitans]